MNLTIGEPLWESMRCVTLQERIFCGGFARDGAHFPDSSLLISPKQAQFMAQLIHLNGARRTIEIGVYPG